MTNEILNELKDKMDVAKIESRWAMDKYLAAQKAYAMALAEGLGVHVGSIVRVTQSIGYGRTRRTVVKRFRVHSIQHKAYGCVPLKLYGVTIRKDGSNGEKHEIYQDWELERESIPTSEPTSRKSGTFAN